MVIGNAPPPPPPDAGAGFGTGTGVGAGVGAGAGVCSSGAAGVVTETLVDGAEKLFAASYASTVYVWGVAGVRFMSWYVGVLDVAVRFAGVHDTVSQR